MGWVEGGLFLQAWLKCQLVALQLTKLNQDSNPIIHNTFTTFAVALMDHCYAYLLLAIN